MKVKCPKCKIEMEYSTQNRFRPFCSERCRLIDLGKWIEGNYSVPAQELDEKEFEALEDALSRSGGDSEHK